MTLVKHIFFNLFAACTLAALLSSCGTNASQNTIHKPLTFTAISHRICPDDTTQSYEVYLPSGYAAQKKWPVIYVFDPHGDGKLAVEHFKEAAEMFGYIVLGSNNSRNGLPTLEHTVEIMLKDASQAYSINPGRQYAGGFSGGGRVAQMIAQQSGNIKGIITCSAGLAGFSPQNTSTRFDIYAIAGREDFNFDEVTAIQQQLAGTDWRFAIAAFDGGHTWPPASYITKAVLWFQLNAMKDGLLAKDDALIDALVDSTLLKCKELVAKNQYLRATEAYNQGISALSGLTSTKKLEKKLKEIQEQEAFSNELHKSEQLKQMEEQLKSGYVHSFTTQNLDWWKTELSELTKRIAQEPDLDSRQMYSRIKGFLGIVCYSYTARALQDGKDEQITKCLEIYETIEPQNPDCFYYKAQYLDRKGKYNDAATSLKTAVGFGFKDLSKAQSQLSGKTWKLFQDNTK